MQDPRLDKLARLFLDHSLSLTQGDGFLISAAIEAQPLVKAILRAAEERGVYPLLEWTEEETTRLRASLFTPGDEAGKEFLDAAARVELSRWDHLRGHLALRAVCNDQEMAELPAEHIRFLADRRSAVRDRIINERKWVLFNWPTAAQAQNAGMSRERFFDYTLQVCDLDYDELEKGEKALAAYLQQADRVRIEGPGTDVTFSIRNMPVVCSYGQRNLPDGEVFTAPIADSAEGHVTYNVPSSYWGHTFRSVRFQFRKGLIVDATCDGDGSALGDILDADPGARRLGEFAFGVNPLLLDPVGTTLFDEKIGGSFHLTPGNAYARADNGNRSAVHWDLVSIQRSSYGGGKIWLDDQLIRENGIFLPDDLRGINPAAGF